MPEYAHVQTLDGYGLNAPDLADEATEGRLDSPCAAYLEMLKRWEPIIDLWGGQTRMHAVAKKWLLMMPAEEEVQYQFRLKRSTLFGAFKRTVRQLAAKPFSQPTKLRNAEGFSEQLVEIEKNCDKQGNDLTTYGRYLSEDVIKYGLTHVLIDYPKTKDTPDAPPISLDEQRAQGVRPYFIHLSAVSLFFWDYSKSPTGEPVLNEIRWCEYVNEVDQTSGKPRRTKYIMVYKPTVWERHRYVPGEKRAEDKFELVASGENTLGKIPLVTMYADRTAFMEADPPLEELAWKNIEHYNSASDQRNILTFVRVGVLMFSGLDEKEMAGRVVLGPNRIWRAKNPNARAMYVENTGAGAKLGADDLRQIKEDMEALGMEPVLARTAPATATAVGTNEMRTMSPLQSWAINVGQGLRKCYELAGEWTSQPIPEDFEVEVFTKFELSSYASQDAAIVQGVRRDRDLTRVTALRELIRLGKLSDAVDPEKEDEMLKAEEAEYLKNTPTDENVDLGDEPTPPGFQEKKPPAADEAAADDKEAA